MQQIQDPLKSPHLSRYLNSGHKYVCGERRDYIGPISFLTMGNQPEERLELSLTWVTKTLDSLAQDG
jgi:hypothetical protein